MTDQRFAIISLLLLALLGIGIALLYSVFSTAYEQPQVTLIALQPQVAAAGRETAPPATDAPSKTPTTLPPTWTPTATATPWPTPTQVPPTPTATFTPSPIPTALPLRRPTAAPIRITVTPHPSATLLIPTAVPRLHISENAVTVVLLGSDQRPDWNDWHTDVIQYVIVYPDVPSVAILSIPRDLYVYVPDFWMTRINFADMYGESYNYEGGGLGLLNQTLLYNLGITADYYVKVNFDGLIGLVNVLDGIDMPVHCQLEDYWPYPNEAGEYPWLVLSPGIHHLDGERALWYSRSRKTTSVFSRERRQQQVLEAMWRQAKNANMLAAAPELYAQWKQLFETDLGLGNILSLAVTAAQLDPVNVNRYNIGYRQVRSYVTPYGGNVFLPVWEEIEPVLQQLLAPPAASRAAQSAIPVEVWNGTGYATWDQLAADRLRHAGYAPILGNSDGNLYPQTQIIFFGSTTKGSGLSYLQTLFDVPPANVSVQEDPAQSVKLRLILGQDYQTCR